MRHEPEMLPVEDRSNLSIAKLYGKIRRNTKHQLHTMINRMRQRNGWIRYRNVTQSHQDNWRNQHNYKDTTPPHGNNYRPYECRIDCARSGVNGNTETKITIIYMFSTRRHISTISTDQVMGHGCRGGRCTHGRRNNH